MKLSIHDQVFIVKEPLTHIQGLFEPEEIKLLPNPIVNWNEFIPSIFDDGTALKQFFFEIQPLLSQKSTLSDDTFLQFWSNAAETFEKTDKMAVVFQNLQKVQQMSLEKNTLMVEVKTLQDLSKKMEEMSKESVYATKQDLFTKLNLQLQNLQGSYEINHDEYMVRKNQMDQQIDAQTKFQETIKELKLIQRELFKETNQITESMDKIENQVEVYREKLNSLDPEKSTEDYERISGKCIPLEQEMVKVKSQRSEKIKNSRQLKQQLTQITRQLRDRKKKISKLKPAFAENEARYMKIKQEYEGLQSQQLEVSKDLEKLVQFRPISSSSSSSDRSTLEFSKEENNTASSFTSLEAVLDALKTKRVRLGEITQKLLQVLNTQDEGEIGGLLDGKKEELLQKIKVVQQSLLLPKDPKEVFAGFHDQFRLLNRSRTYLNEIMKPLGIRVEISLGNSTKEHELALLFSIYRKNKLINLDTDMKRQERAYFYMGFILSLYLAADLKVIPVYVEYLPKNIRTKQTFTKAIQNLRSELDSNPIFEEFAANIRILVFSAEEFGLEPKIKINCNLNQ